MRFARVLGLPGDADLSIPDTLAYLDEVDPPLRGHLARWARAHQVGTAATYVTGLGAAWTRSGMMRLRAEIGAFLDGPASTATFPTPNARRASGSRSGPGGGLSTIDPFTAYGWVEAGRVCRITIGVALRGWTTPAGT